MTNQILNYEILQILTMLVVGLPHHRLGSDNEDGKPVYRLTCRKVLANEHTFSSCSVQFKQNIVCMYAPPLSIITHIPNMCPMQE